MAKEAINELSACPESAKEAILEPFICPVTATEADSELSELPVMAIEAVNNLTMLLFSFATVSSMDQYRFGPLFSGPLAPLGLQLRLLHHRGLQSHVLCCSGLRLHLSV